MLLMAATMASTFAGSRPSEKFGTHSIRRFIALASCCSGSCCSASCYWSLPSCAVILACDPAALAVHKRNLAFSPQNLALPERALAERLRSERPASEPPVLETPSPVSGLAVLATKAAPPFSLAIAVQSSVSSRAAEARAHWALGLVLRPVSQRPFRFLLSISPQYSLSTGSRTK